MTIITIMIIVMRKCMVTDYTVITAKPVIMITITDYDYPNLTIWLYLTSYPM